MRVLIQKLRKEAGISQGELANMVGIQRPYLSQLENGNRKLTLEMQEQIARALNVAPAQLVDFEAYPEEMESALIETFRQLSPEKRAMFLKVVKAMSDE